MNVEYTGQDLFLKFQSQALTFFLVFFFFFYDTLNYPDECPHFVCHSLNILAIVISDRLQVAVAVNKLPGVTYLLQVNAYAGKFKKILRQRPRGPFLQAVVLLWVYCLASPKGEVLRGLGQFFQGIAIKSTLNWPCVTFSSDVGTLKKYPSFNPRIVLVSLSMQEDRLILPSRSVLLLIFSTEPNKVYGDIYLFCMIQDRDGTHDHKLTRSA